MSEKTIQSIKAEGERLLEEVRKISDDSYNEVHRKTEEFKNTVDLKYGVIVTNMNDRMDKVKNEFKDYATKKYASLNKMINSYVDYYMLKRKLDEKRLMAIRGSYPLTDNINNKAGGDIASYNEVYLSIPKQSCILYANYRIGSIGYDFKTNEQIFPRFYNRDLKYLGSGIVSTLDGRLYYQKIKNEGIWHGVGTVNRMNKLDYFDIYPSSESLVTVSGASLFSGYQGKSVVGNISSDTIIFSQIVDLRDRLSSMSMKYNLTKNYKPSTEGWYAANIYPINTYAMYNNENRYESANSIVKTSPEYTKANQFLTRIRATSVTSNPESVYLKDVQYESLPVCTPYVVDKREQSSLSYDNNPNTKSIIIKCRKINPIDEVIEIYQDNNINIKALKYIKYFFDKEENNTVIINLQSKDLYVNGILIPKSYWFIVSDSIGVIIDESRTTPVLSRKIPMENIIHNNTFTGVIIDESVETVELTREGDLNAKS